MTCMRSRANWEKGEYETSGIRISGFGEVFKALDTISHDLVAIKKVKLLSNDKGIEKKSELLKECQSRYIVRYHSVLRMESELWVRMI